MADFLAAAASDTGRQREVNEDRVICQPERGIFAVIDGVGGQAAGEVAADLAHRRLLRVLSTTVADAASRVREAITLANNTIYRQASDRPDLHDMACVVTVLLLEDGRLTAGHVGDTRLYKIRRGAIRQITRDHSPIGEREAAGRISETEAMRHPRRNEIYRDLGSEPHDTEDPGFIDLFQEPFEADCALVLCSDGLSDLVPAARIQELVERSAGGPQTAVARLIAEANGLGGRDNITVIVVEARRFAESVGGTIAPRQAPPPAAERALPQGFAVQAKAGGGSARRLLRGLARTALWLVFLATVGGLLLSQVQIQRLSQRLAGLETPRVLTVGPGVEAASPSISAALLQARPGETVEVGAGVYSEPIRLRSGVALIARPTGGAVLRPASSQGSTDELIAVRAAGVRGARLAGFRIVGDADRPLRVGVNLVDCEIVVEDMEITGASVAGIAVAGQDRSRLRFNRLEGNAVGLRVGGEAAPHILHNLIVRNRRFGIELEPRAAPLLIGNRLLGNAGGAIAGDADGAAAGDWNDFGATPEGDRFRPLEEPAAQGPEDGGDA